MDDMFLHLLAKISFRTYMFYHPADNRGYMHTRTNFSMPTSASSFTHNTVVSWKKEEPKNYPCR
jgi:hypothetical protein